MPLTLSRAQIDQLAEDLFGLVPQLHRMLDLDVRQHVAGAISAAQLRLLTDLQHGPQTMSALARHQHVSPQAVCDLLHSLVDRGWVARSPHPRDRRQHVLTLTEAGEAAVTQARTQALAHLTPHLLLLSDAERSIVAAALPALQRLLDLSTAPVAVPLT